MNDRYCEESVEYSGDCVQRTKEQLEIKEPSLIIWDYEKIEWQKL